MFEFAAGFQPIPFVSNNCGSQSLVRPRTRGVNLQGSLPPGEMLMEVLSAPFFASSSLEIAEENDIRDLIAARERQLTTIARDIVRINFIRSEVGQLRGPAAV